MKLKLLRIAISPTAQYELLGIWQYNLARNGLTRADRYDDFLRTGIDKLAANYHLGKIVDAKPELRYTILKRRSKGDGHVVVYRVGQMVEILHLFHTKQDWPNKV